MGELRQDQARLMSRLEGIEAKVELCSESTQRSASAWSLPWQCQRVTGPDSKQSDKSLLVIPVNVEASRLYGAAPDYAAAAPGGGGPATPCGVYSSSQPPRP